MLLTMIYNDIDIEEGGKILLETEVDFYNH